MRKWNSYNNPRNSWKYNILIECTNMNKPKGKLIQFRPYPSKINRLKRNIKRLLNWNLNNKILSIKLMKLNNQSNWQTIRSRISKKKTIKIW